MDGEGVSVIGSQSYLVDVASRKKRFWRSRTAVERRLKIVALALVLLVVGLVVALSVVAAMNETKILEVPCASKTCVISANMLLEGMDTSVDPCQDFYAFACNNWPKNHPLKEGKITHSWFVETTEKINNNLQRILEDHSSGEEDVTGSIKHAKTFYRSCTNKDTLERVGMLPLLRLLKLLGLPDELPSISTLAGFSLSRSLALVQRYLGMDLVLAVNLRPEIDKGLSRNVLSLEMPKGRFPVSYLIAPSETIFSRAFSPMDKEKGEYTRILHSVATGIMAQINDALPLERRHNDSTVRLMALKTIIFDRNIAAMQRSHLRAISNERYENGYYTTIDQIQLYLDFELQGPHKTQINITEYLVTLLRGVDADFSLKHRVMFLDRDYIFHVARTLAEAQEVTVQRYVWWKVVETLAPYTTREARRLHDELRLFVEPSYVQSSRSAYCVQLTRYFLPDAVQHAMSVVHPVEDKVVEVRRMLGNIQAALGELMRRAEWMSAAARDKALEKLAGVKWLVGYSPLHTNVAEVAKEISGLKLNPGAFLSNIVNVMVVKVETILKSISKRAKLSDEDRVWNDIDPLQVNAFYSWTFHAIAVPPSILQPPFYDRGLDVLNHGTIGTVLGHELTHGFDSNGRKYDSNGQEASGWDRDTVLAYEQRAQCFVEQYDEFNISASLKVDGEHTLAENIADNGGVREAYMAYQMHVKRAGREASLIGFENYTHEQLFFLAFANLWCSIPPGPEYDEFVVNNRHSPQRARVTGVLSNMPEFADAWHCSNDSAMRPPHPCTLW